VTLLLLRAGVLLIGLLIAAVGVHSALQGEPMLFLICTAGAVLMGMLSVERRGPVSEDAPVESERRRRHHHRRYE
jgi:UDP-N-acetylmuramyl pentapeptide phosphotransferase/UDP-N-acetylglucosamine-1-phosphate transferase